MATIPKQKPAVAYTRSGGPPHRRSYPEAASQTFKRGDFVFLSGGKVTICADDQAASTGAGTNGILGIADQDATGVTDTPIICVEASPDVVFVVNNKSTTAVADVGKQAQLDLTSSNWTIDVTDNTGGQVSIVGLDPRDTVGDTNGRLLVTVLTNFCQTVG